MGAVGNAPRTPPEPGRPYDRGDRAAALLLFGLGLYGIALWAWLMAQVLPIVALGPGDPRAVDAAVGLIIVAPASIVGALGLVPAWAVWRVRRWGRTAGVAWAIVVGGFYGVGLVRLWAPVAGILGDLDRWGDFAQPRYFVPLPFVLGGAAVILLLARRSTRPR